MTVSLVDRHTSRRIHPDRIDKINLVFDEIDLPKHAIREMRPVTRAQSPTHRCDEHARNDH